MHIFIWWAMQLCVVGREALKNTLFPQKKADIFTFHISKTEQPTTKQSGPWKFNNKQERVVYHRLTVSQTNWCWSEAGTRQETPPKQFIRTLLQGQSTETTTHSFTFGSSFGSDAADSRVEVSQTDGTTTGWEMDGRVDECKICQGLFCNQGCTWECVIPLGCTVCALRGKSCYCR